MLRPYVFIQLWQANVDFHISKMCFQGFIIQLLKVKMMHFELFWSVSCNIHLINMMMINLSIKCELLHLIHVMELDGNLKSHCFKPVF